MTGEGGDLASGGAMFGDLMKALTDKQVATGGAFFGELVKALVDKQGQVDIRVKRFAVNLMGTPLGLEMNGTVTMVVHMRDLSEKEKQAHRDANLSAIKK